jgi:mono/diheme cytochrome c family protein
MRAFLTRPHARWRIALEMLALGFAFAIVCGALLIYAGAYDVAATRRHWPLTEWLLDTARMRSIKARAAAITAPAGLDDQAKILMGTEHFADHCAVCHGAPGVPKGDIANGLYPQPPDLAATANRYTATELFWIIKHGIKMTGMPGWPDHGDDELWATVAFLQKLPGMMPEEYGKLVQQVMSHGMQHHPGGSGDKGEMQHGGTGNMPGHEHDGVIKDQAHGHDAVPPGVPKDH